jgi:hypothetical protein
MGEASIARVSACLHSSPPRPKREMFIRAHQGQVTPDATQIFEQRTRRDHQRPIQSWGHPSARAMAVIRSCRVCHARIGGLVQHRLFLEPIGNIPPVEAEQRYYAMLDDQTMAAQLTPTSVWQSLGGSHDGRTQSLAGHSKLSYIMARCRPQAHALASSRKYKKPETHRVNPNQPLPTIA